MSVFRRSRGSRSAWRVAACIATFGMGLVMSVHVTGCTIVGVMIGAAADAGRPALQGVPTREVARFDPGDSLVLHLKDGTRIAGRYAGATRLGRADYEARYARWRAGMPGVELPAIGDSVRIIRRTMIGEIHGALRGFSYEGIEFARPNGTVGTLPYGDVGSIVFGADQRVQGQALEQARAGGAPPVATAITMDTAEGRMVVGFDDVATISGPSSRSGAVKGLAIGMTADAILVFAAMMKGNAVIHGSECGG